MLRKSLPWTCLCSVFLAGGMSAAEVPSQLFRQEGQALMPWYYPDDESSRITASAEVVTPHIEWTKPSAGGRLRVLAIAHKVNGRWPVELAQRFDFEITTVYAHSDTHLGVRAADKIHCGAGRVGQRPWDVEARLLAAMNEPLDVIVNDLKLETLGEKVSQRLRERLAGGVGYVGPTEGLDLAGYDRAADAERAMFEAAVPFSGLRAMTEAFPSLEEAAPTVVKLRQGGGRRLADLRGFVWEKSDVVDPERLQYPWLVDMQWEAWCSLIARAAYWVAGSAGGPPAAGTMKVDWPAEPIERARLPLTLTAAGRPGDSITMRVWDADSRLRHEGQGLTIPQLPAGRYFLGLQQTSDGRIADWSFGTFEVTAPAGIASVEIDDPHRRPDQTVRAEIALAGDPEAGSTLQLEVLDNYGRSISLKKKRARQRVEFKAELSESLHIYNYVNAVLLDKEGRPVDERRRAFYVRQPVPPHDDLTTMIWDPDGAPRIHRRILLDRFAKLGMRAALGERPLALANTHLVHWVLKLKGVGSNEKGETSPNLASPAHVAGTQAGMKKKAEEYEPFSPLFYYLGDDVRYLGYGQDAGWSAEARASLAEWAKRTYGDVEDVNEAWGTSYTDLDQVEPIKHADMLAALRDADPPRYGRLCHWVDHQLHQDRVFSGFIRALGDALNEVAPDTRSNVGSSVVGWTWPGSGIDFWALTENKRLGFQYPNPWVHDIFRDALAPDAFHGAWYGGYGLYNYPPYYFDQDYLPWWGLFYGVNLHGLYYGANAPSWGDDRLLGADLAPLPGPAKIFAHHRELKGGIAKLIFNAERVGDGVAMLYSPSAIHASTVFDRGLPMDPQWQGQDTSSPRFIYMQCWEGMKYLVRDLGLSFQVVPASHLDDGQFLAGGFRVLVMPFNLRLTAAEAGTVRRFVEEGGVLVADAFPGLFDGRCRVDHAGALADVFGVDFAGGFPEDRVKRETAAMESGALPRVAVDTGLVLTAAKAGGKTEGGTPIFTVNTYGRGTAILLNVLARDYQIWRTAAIEMPFRDALGRLLAEAGVEPYPVKCVVNRDTDREHAIQATEIHRYELDGAGYVGLLRHAKLRPDDSVFMADLRAKPVWITLDRPGHVYEMRSGTYRGHTDSVEDMIYPARAELYAVLPYEVRGLEVGARPEGQAIVVRGEIVPGTPDARPVTHVVHVEITDPSGRLRRELTRNAIAGKGKFKERFFVGHRAPAGRWTIEVRDAASGVTRSTSLDL